MARGSNYISLDAKGRMSIPTKLRAALIGDTEGRLVVTISPTDKCLLLYKLDDWNVVEQKLVALPTLNSQTRTLKRMLIGNADDCAMDASGRILVAESLREFAGIAKKAVLVGQGDKFEIWAEAQWVSQRDSMFIEELDESALSAELEALSF